MKTEVAGVFPLARGLSFYRPFFSLAQITVAMPYMLCRLNLSARGFKLELPKTILMKCNPREIFIDISIEEAMA